MISGKPVKGPQRPQWPQVGADGSAAPPTEAVGGVAKMDVM